MSVVIDIKTKRKGSDYIDRLNKRHAVVRMGTQTVILDEVPGQPPVFMTVENFHLWYANDLIEIPTKTKGKDGKERRVVHVVAASRLWLKSPHRRQYERVVFDPTDKNPNHFNLWQGFSVQPDASKSCAKFLAHIRDNICSGDEEHFRWVMGFLAHMVQHPEEKAGVSLVMRGLEGVGKGFFVNWIGRLCPQHYVVISQAAHLTGRFNAHQQQCLLLFSDEAFWAGDKQGEGALKHLVTDTELLIEPKGVNAFMVRNLSRLIIASNEHWVAPAGISARRWCVLDVANTYANDRKYFGAIDAEMKDGGLAGLMHVLMTFDLASVDIHTVPKTAALLDQKTESLPPHERWWLECLDEGRLKYEVGDSIGLRGVEETNDWPKEIEKENLWLSYSYWSRRHNIRSRLWSDGQLHKWLKLLLPGSEEVRPWKNGKAGKRILKLPSLDACREAFANHVGQTPNWGEANEDPFTAYGNRIRSSKD